MSGTPRLAPVTASTLSWYDGRAKYSDVPPPLASGSGSVEPPQYSSEAVL